MIRNQGAPKFGTTLEGPGLDENNFRYISFVMNGAGRVGFWCIHVRYFEAGTSIWVPGLGFSILLMEAWSLEACRTCGRFRV